MSRTDKVFFRVFSFLMSLVIRAMLFLGNISLWRAYVGSRGRGFEHPLRVGLNQPYPVDATRHAEIKGMLWLFAEPHDEGNGAIPEVQYELIKLLCAGRWCGGATPMFLSAVDAIRVEEGLHIC